MWIAGKTASKWFCTPWFISDHHHSRVEGRKTRFPLLKELISFLPAAPCFPWNWSPMEAKEGFLSHLTPEKDERQVLTPRTQSDRESLQKRQRILPSFSVSWGSLVLEDGWYEAWKLFRFLVLFFLQRGNWLPSCYVVHFEELNSESHFLILFLAPVQHYLKRILKNGTKMAFQMAFPSKQTKRGKT